MIGLGQSISTLFLFYPDIITLMKNMEESDRELF